MIWHRFIKNTIVLQIWPISNWQEVQIFQYRHDGWINLLPNDVDIDHGHDDDCYTGIVDFKCGFEIRNKYRKN